MVYPVDAFYGVSRRCLLWCISSLLLMMYPVGASYDVSRRCLLWCIPSVPLMVYPVGAAYGVSRRYLLWCIPSVPLMEKKNVLIRWIYLRVNNVGKIHVKLHYVLKRSRTSTLHVLNVLPTSLLGTKYSLVSGVTWITSFLFTNAVWEKQVMHNYRKHCRQSIRCLSSRS